ncbi:hypothetical protein V502_11286 [Pseudogymnoascus sp. VKM F-4520 (FW-2644)]|nr:hypothetical protein V502_11286 [Pseudogymnoascus sp. VKM F-4520 (FW-2644)]
MHVLSISYLAFVAPLVAALPSIQPRSGNSQRYDMPLTWTSFGFTTQMTLGTPPQSVTSFVDWTWNSQYILTTTCFGKDENKDECLLADQQYFNQSQSKTWLDVSSQYPSQTWNPNHFFFSLNLTVDYVQDIQTIGPSSAHVRLQSGDFRFKQDFVYPFSGVYGLSPVFAEQNNAAQSTYYQAYKQNQWPSPLIAFHYCYNGSVDTTKATCGGHDGIQTLGGFDPNRVKGGIEWYSIINFTAVNSEDFIYDPGFYDYWTVPLSSLSLGDEPQALNKSTGSAAVFDHASYGRGAALSDNAYLNLVKKAGATKIVMASPPNNGEQDFFEFDCARTASLPPIKYQFGKNKRYWEILPRNYVVDYKNGTCVLDIRTLGDEDFIIGNFGETFSKDKYVLMDFEKRRVGISDVKW